MKEMLDTKLIDAAKKLTDRIHPGSGEGDVEIGGDLEVDGDTTISGNAKIDGDIYFSAHKGSGFQFKTIGNDTAIYFSEIGPNEGVLKNAYGYALGFDNYGLYLGYSIGSSSNIKTGITTSSTQLKLIFNGKTDYITLNGGNNALTAPNGTASFVYNEFDSAAGYVPGKYAIHADFTEDLGTETSGNITFSGALSVTGKYTGVLTHGGVLVGICYFDADTKTLSYQNPLGLNLASGEYTANLTRILPN